VAVTPKQHFTKPPPRFTEASLVKALEEIGVGRPSTYASTLSVLRVTPLVMWVCGHVGSGRGLCGVKIHIITWIIMLPTLPAANIGLHVHFFFDGFCEETMYYRLLRL
jgi:hypothetical protein